MHKQEGQPWWKFGHVWLVFAGPAVVVVASFITLYLAIKIPDPVVTGYNQGSRLQAARPELAHSPSMAPAMQARNHAATGVSAPAKP